MHMCTLRLSCHERHTELPDKVTIASIHSMKSDMFEAPALVDAIGTSAAVMTTLCWVQQALKLVRDCEARAISLSGTLLCIAGVLLWLVYGLAITDDPLIGLSAATLAITMVILALKIRHG